MSQDHVFYILVSNIIISEEDDMKMKIAERLECHRDDIFDIQILKRSVDGRRRPPVWLGNYKVEIHNKNVYETILLKPKHGVRPFNSRDKKRHQMVDFSFSDDFVWPKQKRVIVVGAGPAGMFAALRLAQAGANAILLERGGDVQDRHVKVRQFWRHQDLHAECNVVYGEGGAGAFSDGKIYTRKRDGELGWVFEQLVKYGADPEILEEGWAHLGTDKIREILPNIRQAILQNGIEVQFHCRVTDLIVDNNICKGVLVEDESGEKERIEGDFVIMATGHSARDSWEIMLRSGAAAEIRPIRIGARIEHPQKLIDISRYGQERGELPPASYRLVSKPKTGRGAHTFCMCPGGTVVGATAQSGRVVVNGMSYSGRKAFYANSAIIVQVEPSDYDGTDPMAGVRFQDAIEQKAFEMTENTFRAPAQNVKDFLQKKKSTSIRKTSFPQGVHPCNLWELFPTEIAEGLKMAILQFDKKISGFASEDGVLIAPETRTSAPIRFLRDDFLCSTTIQGLMPVGEGAGYAGGIASAALDGFRAVQSIVKMIDVAEQKSSMNL